MKQPTFVIGMDGGGTKTHAVITNRHGHILAEHVSGPSNFQIIGVEKSAAVIFSLVERCCESVGCTTQDIACVACGLTGAGRFGDQKRMADGLKKYARARTSPLKKIIIDSDARIALEGAFNGEAGIILIAGTGSIAFGKDARGNVHRVGGWGRILGDEGSGYYIGRLALTAVTHHRDGRGKSTILTRMIAKRFGLVDQTAIINAVYKNSFDVASVAPLVLEGAAKKDQICRWIVYSAVIALAEHVKAIAKRIERPSRKKVRTKIPLSFIGGLIANDTILSSKLRRYIGTNFPNIDIIAPRSTPAYGAALLGLRKGY